MQASHPPTHPPTRYLDGLLEPHSPTHPPIHSLHRRNGRLLPLPSKALPPPTKLTLLDWFIHPPTHLSTLSYFIHPPTRPPTHPPTLSNNRSNGRLFPLPPSPPTPCRAGPPRLVGASHRTPRPRVPLQVSPPTHPPTHPPIHPPTYWTKERKGKEAFHPPTHPLTHSPTPTGSACSTHSKRDSGGGKRKR